MLHSGTRWHCQYSQHLGSRWHCQQSQHSGTRWHCQYGQHLRTRWQCQQSQHLGIRWHCQQSQHLGTRWHCQHSQHSGTSWHCQQSALWDKVALSTFSTLGQGGTGNGDIQWLERLTRDQNVAGSSPDRSIGKIFFYISCQLLSVPPLCYRSSS